MKLSKQDADLYFKLMWSLQNYVNLKLEILSEVATVDEYRKLPSSEKLKVREKLYENIELIDAYQDENPQNFSKDELKIIDSWKRFEQGDYFIERLLKKYAIFIGGNKVYAVLALYEPFENVLPYVNLPYYAKAVLLPFKGKIIYDGLLQGYTVSFGSGIRYDLKETYMSAKQNGRIIESFDPLKKSTKAVVSKKLGKDLGPIIDGISGQVKNLRASSTDPAIFSPAFRMAKVSIEFAKLSVETPDDIDGLWKALKKVENAVKKAETVLFRLDYD
jgi:hypothetical protein